MKKKTDTEENLLTPIPEKIQKKMKKNQFYVNNEYFIEMLKQYGATKNKKAYEEIGKIFILIARGLLFKGSFNNYSPDFKQDMESDAIYAMVKYASSFDPKRENASAFNYFTTIAYNAYRAFLNKYKKDSSVMLPISYIEGLGREADNQ